MAELPSTSDIKELKDKLFNPSATSGWILLGYSGNKIVVQAYGEGGVEDFVGHLQEDQIQYIVVRLLEKSKAIQDRKDGKQVTRDVFIQWLGPDVRPVEKGKKQAHLGSVTKLLSPVHAEIVAINKKNINHDTVFDRSNPLSGSHVID